MQRKSVSHKKIEVATGAVGPQGAASETLTVRLQVADSNRLERAAKQRRLAKGTIARLVICEWLDRNQAA